MNKVFVAIMLGILMLSTGVSAAQLKTTDNGDIITMHASVPGLENAIIKANNEYQREHIESVLAKIQAKRMERLQALSGLEFSQGNAGQLVAIGYGDATLFGLFKVHKRMVYEANEGGVLKYKPLWIDRLYTEHSQWAVEEE